MKRLKPFARLRRRSGEPAQPRRFPARDGISPGQDTGADSDPGFEIRQSSEASLWSQPAYRSSLEARLMAVRSGSAVYSVESQVPGTLAEPSSLSI